jgi:hypothetical protein
LISDLKLLSDTLTRVYFTQQTGRAH